MISGALAVRTVLILFSERSCNDSSGESQAWEGAALRCTCKSLSQMDTESALWTGLSLSRQICYFSDRCFSTSSNSISASNGATVLGISGVV
jgi:hypothetical protein